MADIDSQVGRLALRIMYKLRLHADYAEKIGNHDAAGTYRDAFRIVNEEWAGLDNPIQDGLRNADEPIQIDGGGVEQ